MNQLFGAFGISSTGLTAERMRMEVVANNIANAFSTRSASGGPYRRQDVMFGAVLDQRLGGGVTRHGQGGSHLAGVQVLGVVDDPSAFRRIHNPGHPDADAEGYVNMPNVDLPVEMVNLVTASRAYEANLRALHAFRQMAEQSLTLLRSQP